MGQIDPEVPLEIGPVNGREADVPGPSGERAKSTRSSVWSGTKLGRVPLGYACVIVESPSPMRAGRVPLGGVVRLEQAAREARSP
jgi:hypothetical protein